MAATPLRPATAGGAPPPPNERFDTRMRFEWADPEQRTLVWSWVVAVGLAIIWLIVVSLYKVKPLELLPPSEVSIQLKNLPEPPPAPPEAAVPQTGKTQPIAAAGPKNQPAGRRGERGNPRQGRPGSRTETNRAGAISDAFGTGSGAGTGGLTGDVSGILRGVAVASGGGGTGGGQGGRGGGGAGGKMVLGYGQGGEGGTTPGRGGFGGGAGTGGGGGGGGIGGVGAGGGISRATVRVQAPRAIASPGLGPAGRDVGELGDYVRSRESQLRFCYQEYGLKSDPSLAGTINVAITMTGSGSVTGVNITNRTWGGPGAAPTESCIRSKINGWHFPASSAGGGTYSFPFNFTK